MIKSIPTSYNGYSCRSRAEARWMVAFDEAKIDYEYEPQGFDLKEAGRYLPDFYLPQVDMYAEVKGRAFNMEELKKARALSEESGKAVLLLDGPPARKAYWAIEPTALSDNADTGGWSEMLQEDEDSGEVFFACDYDIFEHSEYWLYEGRFYCNTGWAEDPDSPGFPKSHYCGHKESESEAVMAARSARFEHGESGSTRERPYEVY